MDGAESLLRVARAAARRGDGSEAAAAAERILSLAPDHAILQREAGLILAGLGRGAEARRALEHAGRLDPGDARVAEALAALALRAGEVEHAVADYRRAAALVPGEAGPWLGLGQALRAAGRPAEAVDALENGMRLNPRDPRGHLHLGLMYLEQGLSGSAVEALERAAALAPGSPGVHANLGLALQTAGDLDAAAAAYQTALRLDPEQTAALRGLARIARARRRPEEGFGLLAPAVAAGTRNGGLLAQYAGLLAIDGRRDEAIRLLETRLAAGLADEDRLEVAFELSALYDAAGEPERAFHHAAIANRLKPVTFDPDAYRALIDRLLVAFDRTAMARLPQAGNQDQRPILIVGMPRSGTSLVEQILASHPSVHGAGELTELGLLALSTAAAGCEYPESISGLTGAAVDAMANAYRTRLDELAPGAARVVDKMWQNFEFLGFAALLLPAARVIWCRRDPADTALSCFFQHFFGTGVSFAYDLAHIGRVFVEHERAMGHWREILELPLLEVEYEKLVTEPQAQIRRLVDFTGLPWDPACLRFHETDRVVRTASYEQVRRPMYENAVGRHRAYERWLGPLYAALGQS